MKKIVVAGCGTGVGKTVVSAIIAEALQADYWKPVQSGIEIDSDIETFKRLAPACEVHDPAYSLKAPLSPHHAAKLENIWIDTTQIIPPKHKRPLIIESVGGVMVPLNDKELTLDLFRAWDAVWVIVSKHYLGSINHTLLTVESLKQHGISVHGIVFNGETNSLTEEAILNFSELSCIGRLLPEKNISHIIIKRYAKQWKQNLEALLS